MAHRRLRSIRCRVCAFLVAAFAATGAFAGEPSPPAAGTPVPSDAPPVQGVTITWDAGARHFTSPSAEQAAELARQLRQMLAERFAGGQGRLADPRKEVEVVVLPNGMRRARLDARHLSLSVVREVGDQLVAACVDGPGRAAEVLSAPVPPSGAGAAPEEQ